MPTMPPRIGARRLWRAALLLLVAAWLALGALTLLVLTAALMPDGAARELLRGWEEYLPDPATFPP